MENLDLAGWTIRRLQSAVDDNRSKAARYERQNCPIAAQIARDWASQYDAEIARRIAAAAPAPAEEG